MARSYFVYINNLYRKRLESRNNSHDYDFIYKNKRIPLKEVIRLVFNYFSANHSSLKYKA